MSTCVDAPCHSHKVKDISEKLFNRELMKNGNTLEKRETIKF